MIGIEAMWKCDLFKKTLHEWEELSSSSQTWDKFKTHFQDAEENFNLKKKIHDKNGGISQDNPMLEE